jgi:iron complex transport system substrate-binding protein
MSAQLSRRAMLALALAGCGRSSKPEGATSGRRLVTVGGPISEIVAALGAGGEIIGVDTSSTFPASLAQLPKVGYQRTLSPEGILALRPTAVIASQDAGPPAVLEQLRGAGVQVQIIQAEPSSAGALAKIRGVAAAIGRASQGEELASRLTRELEAIPALCASKPRLRVLCVHARGAGAVLVSGAGSAAEAMVRLVQAEPAAPEIRGNQPLTPEAALAAKPDVLLTTTHGVEGLGGVDGLLKTPGLGETPAGKARRVIVMDDLLLLGFGPRTAEAARGLLEALHGRA